MIRLLLLVLPAYFANAVPVLLGGGKQIDLGRKFLDGRPILGKSKTIRGFIAGTFTGLLIGELLYLLKYVGIVFFPFPFQYALLGLLLGFGAMLGDSIGSFIKRRIGYGSGDQVLLIDEMLFIAASMALAYPLLKVSTVTLLPLEIIILLAITWVLHKLFNFLANRYKIKNVPW